MFPALAFSARADDAGGREDDDDDGPAHHDADAGHVPPSFVILQKHLHPTPATPVLRVSAATVGVRPPEKSPVLLFCRRVAIDVVLFPGI